MEQKTSNSLPAVQGETSISPFASIECFANAQRIATLLSASTLVPEMYRGEKGLPNCVIALEMASRMGASPFMVMQNLYIVHGNPGWSSKFLVGCINSCGRFTALRYEFKGQEDIDEWGCRAYATEKATGETLYGSWVTIRMAKKEGWFSKPGSKWQTMPQLMMQYRAAAFFQRVYAPDIALGMHTSEEMGDMADYEEVKAPACTVTEVTEEDAERAADILAAETGGEDMAADALFVTGDEHEKDGRK